MDKPELVPVCVKTSACKSCTANLIENGAVMTACVACSQNGAPLIGLWTLENSNPCNYAVWSAFTGMYMSDFDPTWACP